MDAFLPSLEDMQEVYSWFAAWVAYGVGLSVVFWTLGYLVWFIIDMFRDGR